MQTDLTQVSLPKPTFSKLKLANFRYTNFKLKFGLERAAGSDWYHKYKFGFHRLAEFSIPEQSH